MQNVGGSTRMPICVVKIPEGARGIFQPEWPYNLITCWCHYNSNTITQIHTQIHPNPHKSTPNLLEGTQLHSQIHPNRHQIHWKTPKSTQIPTKFTYIYQNLHKIQSKPPKIHSNSHQIHLYPPKPKPNSPKVTQI